MKKKDATQQGAPTDADSNTPAEGGAHFTPRQDRMAAIIKKHTSGEGQGEEPKTHEDWRGEQAGAVKPAEGDNADDLASGEQETPTPGEEPHQQHADGEGEGDGADDRVPADGEQNDPDPNEPQPLNYDGLDGLPLYRMPDGAVKVKMRVHGQDVYESVDRLKMSAQKATAGDLALQQAAKARQDLEAWEKTLKEKEAELASRRQPSTSDAVDETALAEEAKALVEELTLGDTDDAALKLAQFVQKNVAAAAQSGSTVDPAAIVEQAKASLREETEAQARQNEISMGFRKVADKYPDLVSDDRAFQLLDTEAERLEMEHGGDPEWTPSRIMETAADNIAEYLGRTPKPGQPTPSAETVPAGTSQREARKEGMRPIPRAGSAVATSNRPEPVDRSPKSVVQRMREQRNRAAGRQG